MRMILPLLTLTFMVGTAAASESAPADQVFGPPAGACFDSVERIGHDLEGYKARVLAVQEQARSVGETSFRSTLSFSQPLPVAVVREMVQNYRLTPLLMVSHSREPDGKTATAMVRVNQGVEDALSLVAPTGDHQGRVFQGIVSIVGTVPGQVLASLQQDPRVYLVDITGDRQVTKAKVCDGYVNSVVWQLYGLTQ